MIPNITILILLIFALLSFAGNFTVCLPHFAVFLNNSNKDSSTQPTFLHSVLKTLNALKKILLGPTSVEKNFNRPSFFVKNYGVFVDTTKKFVDFKKEHGSLLRNGSFSDVALYDLTMVHSQFLVMLVLAAVLYFLSKIFSKKIFNLEKKSAYECGFEPFLILTTFIEVSYILVAFIFLIFDLELIFLSGFLISSGSIGSGGIVLVVLYLTSVWVMIFFEVFSGVLSWPVWNIFKVNKNITFYSLFSSLPTWEDFFFFLSEMDSLKKLKTVKLKAASVLSSSSTGL